MRERTSAIGFDGLRHLMREASRHRLLTAEEEWELGRRIERGDQAAKDRLIESNLRLVVAIAVRYPRHDLSLVDLVRALGALPDRDRLVIEMRFGLGGATPMTLDQVARKCDLSRARVGQIEHRALQRLRRLAPDQRELPVPCLGGP
jgi:RNA polymerase primary sigma factor